MTQEELDALMNGDMGDIDESQEDVAIEDDLAKDEADEGLGEDTAQSKVIDDKPAGYSEETAHHWPLPATDENKMVHQLDDVTKESEEKASEIFDIIEGVSNDLMEKEENAQRVLEVLESNIELFEKLNQKFPDVEAFVTQLEKNKKAIDDVDDGIQALQDSGDSIMNVMDIMQYQDIHRQKIERVINVMRALARYMNTLFEGQIEDEKRVASAQHIVGDTHNELASTDDIEALLEQFGK